MCIEIWWHLFRKKEKPIIFFKGAGLYNEENWERERERTKASTIKKRQVATTESNCYPFRSALREIKISFEKDSLERPLDIGQILDANQLRHSNKYREPYRTIKWEDCRVRSCKQLRVMHNNRKIWKIKNNISIDVRWGDVRNQLTWWSVSLCGRARIPPGLGELDDIDVRLGIELLALFTVFHGQFFESAPRWISVAEQTAQIQRLWALPPAATTWDGIFKIQLVPNTQGREGGGLYELVTTLAETYDWKDSNEEQERKRQDGEDDQRCGKWRDFEITALCRINDLVLRRCSAQIQLHTTFCTQLNQ